MKRTQKNKDAAGNPAATKKSQFPKSENSIMGAAGSVSGTASILGSWQVCHNVCLGLIGVLGAIGITMAGMPLFFLTKIAIPMWTTALVLLGLIVYLHFSRKCVSKNLILLNSGLIIAGTPFQAVQQYQPAFWTAGGAVAASGIILFAKERMSKKKCRECKK